MLEKPVETMTIYQSAWILERLWVKLRPERDGHDCGLVVHFVGVFSMLVF